MSFHLSAEEDTIYIDDGHILRARLRNNDGDYVDAEIHLNNHLGNENGWFVWEGTGFSNSATNVYFSIEGGGDIPVLRAELIDENGELRDADVNLAERIENDDGQFVFVY